MKFVSLFFVIFVDSFLQIVTSQMITQCTQNGVFALTFDDGVTQYSEQMLDILKEKGVKATFFYIGSNLESDKQKKTAKRAFDEGHQIASHTWSHPELSKLSAGKVKEEMQKTEDNIEEAIGKKVRYMRNPFLDSSEAVDNILRGMDYIQVGVNLDTFDWKVKDIDPDRIFSIIDDTMKTVDVNTQSFISLQHDLTDPKVAKISEIIDLVRSKNFRFVTSEECLDKGPAYRDFFT
ncbi:glycoside hydrolase/deacetylase [Neoconidiobolus thromboides FSU 785]|nr:glycoside hydrolase/deacetylase [Neoconidiobolus thromboides FSU 785]